MSGLERFALAAPPTALAGNRPLVLEPGSCLLVTTGDVELFLVEQLPDGTSGTRQHLFGAGPGSLLFGMDTDACLLDAHLLAIGAPGTEAITLDRDSLLADEAAAAQVDRWVRALSAAITRPIVPHPRPDLVVDAGDIAPRGKERRVAGHDVAWCTADGEGCLYVDMEGVEPGSPLPLTRDSWIAAPADVTLRAERTETLVTNGSLAPALDAFQALALDVLPMALRLASVDEVNRLRARAEGDRRAAANAMVALADVFAARRPIAALTGEDQPLVRALNRLGAVQNFALALPDARDDEPRPFGLEEIARASRLRTRTIALDTDWWTASSGAFLLLRDGDRRPLALWPAGRGYRVYDPVEHVERPLPAVEAAALAGEAVALYPPLPDRPLRVGELLRIGFRNRMADLGTLLGATLLGGVLALAVPLATAYILDTVVPDNDMGKLVEIAAALFLAAAMTFALRFAGQMASVRMEGLAGTRLQSGVMDRLLRLPTGFFRGFTTGELATRVLAIERLESAFTAAMIGSLVTGAMAIVSFGLMFAYSWQLALLALGLALGLAGVTTLLGLRRVRREANAIAEDAQVVGLTLELASGITKLRLAAAEDRAMLRWARAYAAASRSRIEAASAEAQLNATSVAYTALSTAAILALCVYGGFAETLTLGLLVAFLVTFNTALAGAATLANSAIDIVALAPIARHAAPILAATPEADVRKAQPGEFSGAIEISRLKFRYQPDTPLVFNDLSVRIQPGEFVAFVGPSGSGKSTLFRLLLGFEQPESGLILFDGLDAAGLDAQAVRRQFGVVLQNGKLMPGNIRDNILGANVQLGEEDAWDALRLVGLEDDVLRMPMGLHTMVTGGGSTFSGGQVQRVLLARAIVSRPRILLLDEATSALDNRTQATVTENLNRIAATRLVIAHRLSTVEQADRIVVLGNGAVVEEGSYAELVARGGFFAELAGRQLTGR